ncbi:MAG: DNA cytosine methyltransferase [Candidatus Marinimicrobia bacterium]|nr:DNA cytosine methyltransferase [Candidatus Neomarinimicrobiota bacterium]
MKNRKLNVIDLFSGIGGLSSHFYNNSNFNLLCANEINPQIAKTFSLNHPDTKVYVKDIGDLSYQEIYSDFNLNEGDIDIIVGGPPCQAYSTVGKRLLTDPRGMLFQQYFRMLQELKPKFFLFENVTGLLSMKDNLHSHIVDLFKSLGYKVESPVLNAIEYGVPQTRRRVIITGTMLQKSFEYPIGDFSNPKKPLDLINKMPTRTLSEAIGDLPFISCGEESINYASGPKNEYQKMMREGAPKYLCDHNAPKNNEKLIKLMEALPEGGTPKDVQKHLRPSSGFGNSYSRLWWDRPSSTLTRNFGTPSSSRCIHPKVARALTTREGARIQGFPDHFKFSGSRTSKNLQIGNAVPPLLSKAIAKKILEHFNS